ncbi:MAG: alpha/beta fold hydrolase [Acidimicrobiales bacterium]
MALAEGRVRANGIDFAMLCSGADRAARPLALCLHGFPDSAWSWRHLLPALADAGYRAVAPFMRGYAPSSVPADGRYQSGALVADAIALHEALGGGGDAVIVGHDWGAMAAYGAAAHAPARWSRVVTAAVPPLGAMAGGLFRYAQLKRSWYMFFFQGPLAEGVVGADDLAFIDGLWSDWSPGHDGAEDLAHVKDCLRAPANLEAAIGYYRAMFDPTRQSPELAAEQSATAAPTPQPTLYLHGAQDGCVGVGLAEGAEAFLGPGSRVEVIEGAGHFLQVERPAEVQRLVLEFLADA